MLRLPLELRDLFEQWLAAHYPDKLRHVMTLVASMRKGKAYDSTWGERQTGTGPVRLDDRPALRGRGGAQRFLARAAEAAYRPVPQAGAGGRAAVAAVMSAAVSGGYVRASAVGPSGTACRRRRSPCSRSARSAAIAAVSTMPSLMKAGSMMDADDLSHGRASCRARRPVPVRQAFHLDRARIRGRPGWPWRPGAACHEATRGPCRARRSQELAGARGAARRRRLRSSPHEDA